MKKESDLVHHVSEAAESSRESLSSTAAPERWFVCDACGGEGEVGTGRMSHSVNSATIDPPDEIMKRCEQCGGAGGWITDAKPNEPGHCQDCGATIGLFPCFEQACPHRTPAVEERPANESTPQLSKRGSPNTSIASNAYDEMREVLREVESYLDDRADADDGKPNTEMSLLVEVRAALAKVQP